MKWNFQTIIVFMNKKLLTKLAYILASLLIFGVFLYLIQIPSFRNFLTKIENTTFDLRQNIVSKHKKTSDKIVIIDINDASYEYIAEKFGSWPAPRTFWADLIINLEPVNPDMIIFDMLFLKRYTADGNSDFELIKAVKDNKNVYVSMNLDNYPKEVRTPPKLPVALQNSIGNDFLIKQNPDLVYVNCRSVMDEILNGTKNIGLINVQRDKDGIIRTMPPFSYYDGVYYKHLTILAGLDYLNINTNQFKMSKNGEIVFDKNHILPLTKEGKVILNWYGPEWSFNYVPLWKVSNAIEKNDRKFLEDNFKNKIVFVGVTANSLSDIKSTPVSYMFPGVEVQATFLNNLLDNNFIKKTYIIFDIFIAILMAGLIALGVMNFKAPLKSVLLFLGLQAGYFIISIILMGFFNIWVNITAPFVLSILTFAGAYVVKYLITSRDYEHTYKLAVTDGLTEMFNHRYFQEQMTNNIGNAKRYNSVFSLIMVDIDFFKKFNDTYGHQSGDAVLRQVAQTIKRNIRSTDIPCRYGGEEMSVILTNTNKEDAVKTAIKICEAVRNKEFELATGDRTHVTISLGVASMPENGDTTEKLIEYADKCLYVAKRNGRNQVVSDAPDDTPTE